ncbi:MAG: hypothetical protein K2X47_11895 [Bdellovibrionales bacterium]|nr:hypothetical protein [Bdellovibrionales bacterium]
MKNLSLLILLFFCLSPMGVLAQPKSPELAIEPRNFSCDYASQGGSCKVQLVECINQKHCRVQFDGHWVKVSAAYQSMATIPQLGSLTNPQVPMTPKLDSDLDIISVEITNIFGKGTPRLEKFNSDSATFEKCKPTIQAGAVNVVVPDSKRGGTKQVRLSSDKDCELAVLSVTFRLPIGAKVPSDLMQTAMRKAGQEMDQILARTSTNLSHLTGVLPAKRRPLARAYSAAVDELREVLKGTAGSGGQYVNHFQVTEAARNLYIHASVLEAILEKNRNPITEKYIKEVGAVLVQIVPAFGFNDRGAPGKDTPIPVGPLSKGYNALMTGLDVVLQDIIVGLPLASNSAELGSIYDLQSFVQKIKANENRTDNEFVAAISKLQGQWNDTPFQNILEALKNQATERAGKGSTICSAAKKHPILKLLTSIGESLESFSDEEFRLPFKMECETEK